jgi:SAM-dependent methyltransferase
MGDKKEWFVEWFNTPFYHILYKKRDYSEAQLFIDNLAEQLGFSTEHRFMDLCCGKGRHSIYLNQKGFDVTGLDLSPSNIAHAKQFENERLRFSEHDMRQVFAEDTFDFVLNLFTSFGYFDDDAENQLSVNAIATALKPEGILVLDYMNSHKAVANLAPYYEKEVDGIVFKISKFLIKGFIIKNINFEHEGQAYQFQERVQAIEKEHFIEYFEKAGLQCQAVFGSYALEPFDYEASDRMIFVVKK